MQAPNEQKMAFNHDIAPPSLPGRLIMSDGPNNNGRLLLFVMNPLSLLRKETLDKESIDVRTKD